LTHFYSVEYGSVEHETFEEDNMKTTYLALTIACLSLQGASTAAAQPPQQPRSHSHQRSHSGAQQRAAITGLLKSYQQALNASDVEGVARLYTDDAVLLAPAAPSAVGIDAVRAAYTGIFQTIDIDLTFEIAEVNVVSADWAFLRSTSSGDVTVLANGAHVPSSNHELFVLHKGHGRWKIARYSFSSVLPS
jgi:uncharacterized protein (TIGR02246 family)